MHKSLNLEDISFINELINPPSQGEPYTSRKEEKPFLYEIVSNKTNGIDVDKWDYLARDSYYLGVQNNFDYRRSLKFARVIEVDGRKQICYRDKEVDNLYDMYQTRHCLHRRACQHRVCNAVELMITDAFVKADRMFKISETIDDMEAFTKLTDKLFDEILHSPDPELADARKILQNITQRRFYKCVGETHAEHFSEEIKMDWGMGEDNPIDHVRFYNKQRIDNAFQIRQHQVSSLLPQRFSVKWIRVYSKKTDTVILDEAKRIFNQWCIANRFPLLQVR
ncbi:hypothetical protein DPEC_G00005920 [Dallia pectoralis]|uniref:Uncharacterized protein n=1 Tax=Dallia pectoralis TaxID=75939 RepID=A0ACC2HKZ7_DALPE|nr:hypothetical protein DPEC_G00005920 [Dallia pectoralis]